MTSRLNQDNLERFFGMMRNCCGSNDHPDSALFIQMYKLVSTYSLIKPPKGSNVSGGEIIDVLLDIKDIADIDQRRSQWEAQIDTILDKGLHADKLPEAMEILKDHNYFECSTSDYVLAYVAGFVARKAKRFVKNEINKKSSICEDCIASLHRTEEENLSDVYKLIQMRSKGFLIEPSMKLFNLITELEKATLKTLDTYEINADTIFQITTALEELVPLPLVGCEKHELLFTYRVISFYLTTRMFFITKQVNKNDCIEKETTREKRKLSKLSHARDHTKDFELQQSSEVKTKKRKKDLSKLDPMPSKKCKKISEANTKKRKKVLSKLNDSKSSKKSKIMENK